MSAREPERDALPLGFVNLLQTLKSAGHMSITEGSLHVGNSAASAVLDSDFVLRASRWRGGSEQKRQLAILSRITLLIQQLPHSTTTSTAAFTAGIQQAEVVSSSSDPPPLD
jgi:hypothetical protein